MQFVILACVLGAVVARPDSYGASAPKIIEILRDDRVNPEGGVYSFDVQTGDGITRSESGGPLNIEGNPTGQQGSVSFTFPTGETFDLKFVANEGGYQPQSEWLPVAPPFPHEIPDFVLEQIAKAAREDAQPAAPSRSYAK